MCPQGPDGADTTGVRGKVTLRRSQPYAKKHSAVLVADHAAREADKIGAKIVRHGRYVTFQLGEVAIPLPLFAEILQLIADLRLRLAPP